GERAAACLAEAVRRGEEAPLAPLALPPPGSPPSLQWLLPAGLALLLLALPAGPSF
ncbi:MAG: energy transducer TonB, partial [Gammaproteobacteria bacterium]